METVQIGVAFLTALGIAELLKLIVASVIVRGRTSSDTAAKVVLGGEAREQSLASAVVSLVQEQSKALIELTSASVKAVQQLAETMTGNFAVMSRTIETGQSQADKWFETLAGQLADLSKMIDDDLFVKVNELASRQNDVFQFLSDTLKTKGVGKDDRT